MKVSDLPIKVEPYVMYCLVDYRVRELCVRRGWYTCGTCSDYENLFELVAESVCDLPRVIEVAQDIFDHSDVDRIMQDTGLGGYDVLTMMAEELINWAADVVVIR